LLQTHESFKEADAQFRDAGWQGLAAETEYGGQGLPHLLQVAFYEMQYSGNQSGQCIPAFTTLPIECLIRHGTADQKELFVTKLVSGNGPAPCA